jgi:chromosome segregation ATPase
MTADILATAESAIKVSSQFVEEADKQGSLQSRNVVDWSYKLFIATAVVGAVSLVAGGVLGVLVAPAFYPIAAIAALLCGSSVLAAVKIKKFSIYRALEESTRILANRIDLLVQQISSLRGVNNQLNSLQKKMASIPDDWDKQIDKGRREISAKAKELASLTAQLQDAQVKLDKFAEINSKLQESTSHLSQVAMAFSNDTKIFSDKTSLLGQKVLELKDNNIELVQNVLQLDSETNSYESLNQQFAKQISVIDCVFGMMKEIYQQAQTKMQTLTIEIDDLEKTLPAAENSARQLEEMTAKYQQMADTMRDKLQKLKKYEKYKHGYQEWKEWTHSDEFNRYKQWKKAQLVESSL